MNLRRPHGNVQRIGDHFIELAGGSGFIQKY